MAAADIAARGAVIHKQGAYVYDVRAHEQISDDERSQEQYEPKTLPSGHDSSPAMKSKSVSGIRIGRVRRDSTIPVP